MLVDLAFILYSRFHQYVKTCSKSVNYEKQKPVRWDFGQHNLKFGSTLVYRISKSIKRIVAMKEHFYLFYGQYKYPGILHAYFFVFIKRFTNNQYSRNGFLSLKRR